MTLKETIEAHPVPWRYTATGGNVELLDAKGQVVPLFTALDFLAYVTAAMSKR